jgi:hypothetical protein
VWLEEIERRHPKRAWVRRATGSADDPSAPPDKAIKSRTSGRGTGAAPGGPMEQPDSGLIPKLQKRGLAAFADEIELALRHAGFGTERRACVGMRAEPRSFSTRERNLSSLALGPSCSYGLPTLPSFVKDRSPSSPACAPSAGVTRL